MRGVGRKLLGFASSCLTALVFVSAATVAFIDSGYGQVYLDRRTEELAERLLGPGYDAKLARQSVMLASGRLGIRWDDVVIRREGAAEPQLSARHIALGFDLLPLLQGRIAVRSLDVDGVDIDVTSAPSASEVAATARGLAPMDAQPTAPPIDAGAAKALLPALSNRLFSQAEQQISMLRRIGIDEVAISNVRLIVPIAPGGGPFVSYVQNLDLDLGSAGDMRAAGTLRVNDLAIPIETRLNFDAEAKRIVAGRTRLGPIDLDRLLPPGRREDTTDTRPFGSDADLTLRLELATRPEDVRRTVRLAASFGSGHVHQGRGHTDLESGDVALDYVEGEDRVRLGPNRFLGEGFEASFSGELAPIYDRADSGFNGFGLDLVSTTLRSTVGAPTGKPTNAVLRLEGRTNLAVREAALSRIDLRVGEGGLAGDLAFRYGEPDAGLRLHLALNDLSATAVKALWPFDIAVAARHWVHDNVGDTGGLRSGAIDFKATRQRMTEASRPGAGYRPGELDLELTLQGLTSRTLGDLPSLRNGEATVETHGGDTLISIAEADVDGLPDARIEGGLVTFSRVDGANPPRTRAAVNANLASNLSDVIDIAAREPLKPLVELPLKPADATGTVKTTADIGFVLGDDLPNGREIDNWRVAMTLAGAGSKAPLGGRRIDEVSGTVNVDRSAIVGEIEGRVDGAAGAVKFTRRLGEDSAEKSRTEATLRFDASEATKIAPLLSNVVSGPITAELVEERDQRFRADLDLSGSALNMPWLGWRKGKGVPTHLAFALRRDEQQTFIDDIALKGEGFSASGRAEADKEGLREAELKDIALNPGDDVHAKLERVQNGYSVAINGSRFDARPLLADIRNDLGAKTAAPPERGSAQFDVSAAVERVDGFGGEAISDFSLNYAGSGSSIAALSISGRGARGAPFAIDVSPRGDGRSIEVKTENAGSLLDFTGAYGRMEGGKLSLSLLGTFDDGYAGKLEAKNFALVDEPRLSRLVSAQANPGTQSLSQAVGRNLRTERATFDHASAGIEFGRSGLRLMDGIIRGPDFGSSFAGQLYDPKNRIDISGSFMPAYGLNRVFGAIPVVGQILGNGREGGLIGITYRLSGAFSSPKLEINPISAIAPGIFRNIFAYQ